MTAAYFDESGEVRCPEAVRVLLADGHMEEALTELRSLGFGSPAHAQLVLHRFGGLSMHEAKLAIHRSTTWSPNGDGDDRLREIDQAVEDVLRQIDDAGGVLHLQEDGRPQGT
jgi:hypothetical protein